MFRRDFLRSLAAICSPRWLARGNAADRSKLLGRETDSAALYLWAFGRVRMLRPEHSDRLGMPTTVAIDDPKVGALIRQARPMLKAISQAATIERCDWGIDTVTANDLTKGHLDVFATDLIRVACLSSRWHAARRRFTESLDDVVAAPHPGPSDRDGGRALREIAGMSRRSTGVSGPGPDSANA